MIIMAIDACVKDMISLSNPFLNKTKSIGATKFIRKAVMASIIIHITVINPKRPVNLIYIPPDKK